MPHGRFTLLPHGPVQSTDKSREKCNELLIHCGADLNRFHDIQYPRLESFIRYAARFDGLRDPSSPTLVCLTHTCPLHVMIVQARTALSAALPACKNGLWVIYADPEVDSTFERFARKVGVLDAALDNVPVWNGPDGREYLVLTPATSDTEFVKLRAKMLAARGGSPRSRGDMSAVSVRGERPPFSKP